jgi:hypothetical protein
VRVHHPLSVLSKLEHVSHLIKVFLTKHVDKALLIIKLRKRKPSSPTSPDSINECHGASLRGVVLLASCPGVSLADVNTQCSWHG